MKKRFILLFVLMGILLLNFLSCIIVTDATEKDNLLYGFGLTGTWTDTFTGSGGTLINFDNQIATGRYIDSVKYSIGDYEPSNWSAVSTSPTGFTSVAYSLQSINFAIGNTLDINTNSGAAVVVWFKVTSGSDYLISSIYFEPAVNRVWQLTVYEKK